MTCGRTAASPSLPPRRRPDDEPVNWAEIPPPPSHDDDSISSFSSPSVQSLTSAERRCHLSYKAKKYVGFFVCFLRFLFELEILFSFEK